MKLKSLLFGSAAVLAAGTGAQAADLPTVEPVEYVRICDAFGTGYYYIPGTDTCLRVAGRVRVESHYVFGDNDGEDFDFFGNDDVDFNNYTTRARGYVRLDARTQTDIGLVRAYVSMYMTVGFGSSSDNDSKDGPGPNYDSASVDLEEAFIQISNDWGTVTAGHTASNFDFFGTNTFSTRIGVDDPTTEQTQTAWTFAFGNGFSATIAVEDPASSGRRLNGENGYDGQEFPDGVANIRIDQGWGSAQIMGAVHSVHDFQDGDPDETQIGFAVGGGLSLTIPAPMELAFNAQVSYAEGAIGYVTEDPGGIGDINDDDDSLNTAWGIRAGVTVGLTPTLSTNIDGSFTSVEEDDGFNDYDFWAVVANLVWNPVSGLTMGPEVAYNNFQCDGSECDDDEEDDVFGVMWRIQRDF